MALDRPNITYKQIIIESIERSPEKRLLLTELYEDIKAHHPYYRDLGYEYGWKNSIRHNLSLHDCFVAKKLEGVFCHWTYNPETDRQQPKRNRGSARQRRPKAHQVPALTPPVDPIPHASWATAPLAPINPLAQVPLVIVPQAAPTPIPFDPWVPLPQAQLVSDPAANPIQTDIIQIIQANPQLFTESFLQFLGDLATGQFLANQNHQQHN